MSLRLRVFASLVVAVAVAACEPAKDADALLADARRHYANRDLRNLRIKPCC